MIFYVIWKGVCHFFSYNNIVPTSYRFRDMTIFSLKKNIFLPFQHSTPNLHENVSLALDRWNLACLCLRHRANYSCKKFLPTTYRLATIHSWRADRQTDDTSCIAVTRQKLSPSRPINLLRSVTIPRTSVISLYTECLAETHFYDRGSVWKQVSNTDVWLQSFSRYAWPRVVHAVSDDGRSAYCIRRTAPVRKTHN